MKVHGVVAVSRMFTLTGPRETILACLTLTMLTVPDDRKFRGRAK